jgi:hypothetical protein
MMECCVAAVEPAWVAREAASRHVKRFLSWRTTVVGAKALMQQLPRDELLAVATLQL